MSKEIKYKPTDLHWCPEIPEHWNFKKLKFVALVQPSNVNKKSVDGQQEVLLCNYVDVYKNDSIDDSIEFMKATATDDEIVKFILKKDDVLITKDSETPSDIAVPALVEIEKENLLCGYHLAQMRADNVELNGKYLFRLFQSKAFNSNFEIEANGITRYGLSVEAIKSVLILLPPTTEQISIAAFLDAKSKEVETIISKKEKLIEQLKFERTEIINHAVIKGLNEKVEMKPSGTDLIKEIPKSWTTKRIKYIATTFGRIGYRGYQTSDLVNEGEGAITLSPSNMKDLEMDYNKCTYLSWAKYDESPEIQIENGDVIFVKTGSTFGKTALVNNLPEKATINPQLLVFKNIKIINDFFYFVLLSELIRGQVNTSVIGGTIPTISQEKIGNYYLFVPPVEEQKEIVLAVRKHLDRIKTAIATITQEIELIKEYKAALINEVVTGKIILN